ncbi:hypothetical protein [uncultured Faecalibaculum sp.]|uniref:hypothetical protein n=1 Tax=uncultured Faecalibaculum sp. TaxID=1729681 RepID=UPI0025F2ADFB|nr:hypothetical protein [uncultured Faecalibaculum sp.]
MSVTKNEELDRRYLEKLKKLSLKSDVCFRTSVKLCTPEEKAEYMQLLTQAVCQRKTGPFHDVESQKDLKTVSGAKSVMPDLFGYDEKEESWSVGMQNDEIEEGRLDVYSSHLVLDRMPEGEEYSSLTKGHMMIMTDARHLPGLDDPLFLPGKPVVNIQPVDSFTGRAIESKMEIRLFNLRYEGVDAAGDLAHDFRQTDPEKMRNGFLKKLLRRIKNTEKGERTMCEVSREIFRDGRREGRREGLEEGIGKGELQANRKTARELLQMGLLTLQQIAQATSLSMSEVQKLQSERKA